MTERELPFQYLQRWSQPESIADRLVGRLDPTRREDRERQTERFEALNLLEQRDRDLEDYLANLPTGGGGGMPTVVVAASDASALSKSKADYICTGTDDDVTINAALAAHNDGYGTRLVLTEGTFYVNAAISTDTIQGCGMYATYVEMNIGSVYAIDVRTISDLWVHDGTGSGTNPTALILARDTASNVYVTQDWGRGVGIELNTSARAVGCYASGFGTGIYLAWDYTTAVGCVTNGNNTNGIHIAADGAISGCFLDNDRTGVRVDGTGVVSGCWIRVNSATGVAIDVNSGSAVISGCHIDGASGSHGDLIDAAAPCVISGCHIDGANASADAIAITSNDVSVQSCILERQISTAGTLTAGPTIQNNRWINQTSGSTCVTIATGTTNALVDGNDFRTATTPISDSGTGTSTGGGNFVNGTWV